MSIQFNDRQQKAIEGRGDALLVSAAAGSGKTAVLVERILRYLTEQNGDISRLIIMTYTRPAAEELRQKIKRAVDTYLQEQGANERLLRQSTLIDSAEIGTVHSICLGLITRHFEQLELDPRFRLIDETAEQAMLEEETERLLEELYAETDGQQNPLAECFAAGRSDEGLRALLIRGMHFLDAQPLADDYIRRALEPYQHEAEGLFRCFAENGLHVYLNETMAELEARYTFLLDRVRRHPGLSGEPLLMDFLEKEQQELGRLKAPLAAEDFDAFAEGVQAFKFATLNWKKLAPGSDEPSRELIKQERDRFKKAFNEFRKIMETSEKAELAGIGMGGRLLELYFSACVTLRERLAEARRKGGWISYQDMEQMAVKLLVDRYDAGTDTLVPTPLAMQLREDYDEIIIDEFQDTNRAQDLIFRALSKEEKNIFMVGDMKQSIYRFRGAEPEIFDQKRQQSVPYEKSALNDKTVLELNANYRSHPGVLRFANRVFEGIMSPALGGVCYDDRERLVNGRTYAAPEQDRAELHWLQPERDERTGKKTDTIEQNARYTAGLIAKAVAERQEVLLPDGERRPVEYRDFAVLLRTVSATAGVFEQALRAAGIPVENRNEGASFYELFEVQSILSYLLVLNNPYDDVALVSLLYGDYFRFTVGELGAMRHRHTPLFEDLRAAAEENEKAARALRAIEGYRKLADHLYVYDLLYRIYRESGILAAYAAEEGGAEKCANLELLAEDARVFEQEGYRGLYAFTEHIRLSRTGAKSGAKLTAEQNCVRIMSIHKSKGLEYPICILGDAHKGFNRSDQNEKILLHPRYGAAVEQIYPEQYSHFRSLSQRVLAEQITADAVGEEERVFYVALTRAESKVIILLNTEEKNIERWITEGAALGSPLPRWLLSGKDASYGRWLCTLLGAAEEGAALRAKYGLPEGEYPPLHLNFIAAEEAELAEIPAAEEAALPVFDREAFRLRLDWQYPHLSAVRLPAKLSVSELKGLREQDPEAEPLLEEKLRMSEPRFISRFKPRGNEIGNALHQALQFCDFERLRADPEAELARLVQEQFILESQRALIPVERIRQFTESPCFERLMNADFYSKEERFLFPIPAKELFGPEAEGEILIQGVLDCYSVTGGRAEILDYKTDRVESPEELIRRYRVQMELYTEALRRVKGLQVSRRLIYSFSLGCEIEV